MELDDAPVVGIGQGWFDRSVSRFGWDRLESVGIGQDRSCSAEWSVTRFAPQAQPTPPCVSSQAGKGEWSDRHQRNGESHGHQMR